MQKNLKRVEARIASSHLKELEPGKEVADVASQRLQVRIWLLHPQLWYFPDQETAGDLLELGVHNDETLDRFAKVDQRGSDYAEKAGGGNHVVSSREQSF